MTEILLETESLKQLLDLLEEKNIDRNTLDRYTNHKDVRRVLKLYKTFFGVGNKKHFIAEYFKVLKNGNYEDQYYLYETKRKIKELRELVTYIDNNMITLKKEMMSRIGKYADVRLFKRIRVILYSGNTEKGTSPYPGIIYINVRHYINNKESLLNVFVHELYHSRSRDYSKFIKYYVGRSIAIKRHYYNTFGAIFEEGIASLVELQETYQTEDNQVITPETLDHIESHFKSLTLHLETLKQNNPESSHLSYNLNYILGYYMARQIYLVYGKEGLDTWTRDYDYKRYLKLYISACKQLEIKTYLEHQVLA